MIEIVERKYLVSYKELAEKLGLNGEIESIHPHKRIGENNSFPEDFGVEIGMKGEL